MESTDSQNELRGLPAADTVRRRQGCGRRAVVLYGVFLLGAAAMIGLRTYEWFLQRHVLEGLTPAEIADFDRWLDEPLVIPPEFLVKHPPTPPDLLAEKQRIHNLLGDMHRELSRFMESATVTTTGSLAPADYERFASFYESSLVEMEHVDDQTFIEYDGMAGRERKEVPRYLAFKDKLEYGMPLVDAELSSLTVELRKYEPLMNDVERMVARNDYRFNTRGLFPTKVSDDGWKQRYALSHYAALTLLTGDSNAAARHLHSACYYFRYDPEVGGFTVGNDIYSFVNVTSDTLFLQTAINIMTEIPDGKNLSDQAELEMLLGEHIRLPSLLKEYDPNFELPTTRREYRECVFHAGRLSRKTLKRMPESDKRRGELEAQLTHSLADNYEVNEDLVSLLDLDTRYFISTHKWVARARELVPVPWVWRPLEAPQTRAIVTRVGAVQFFTLSDPHSRESADARLVNQNLYLVNTAYRLAVIKGLPEPNSMDTLIREILPRPVTDPVSGKPFLFSQEKNQFFSVGRDGKPGTADDHYHDKWLTMRPFWGL